VDRRFIAQIVHVVENVWFGRGTGEVARSERHYHVEPIVLVAPDEDAAYEGALAELRDHPLDSNHDGFGDRTHYFVLGIHDLVEVSPDARRLPGFALHDVDADGAPFIPRREQLRAFRHRAGEPERASVVLERCMGAPIDARRPSEDLLRSGEYPPSLVELWRDHGFAGYQHGLFWTTDPEELRPLVAAFGMMFLRDRRKDIIGRDAFANLYVLVDGARVERYSPHTGKADPMGEVARFFERHVTYPWSQRTHLWRDLFEPALATRGQLTADECYAFVPLIRKGGKRALPFVRRLPFRKYLERISAVE
jgi:hypothetical protein